MRSSEASEGSDDRSSTSDDEVLLEPRFKYSRILNNVSTIFTKDSASCFAIHDKFVAIGTELGYVHIFDHMGNSLPESTARHHRCPVRKIAIDGSGSYYVSCSHDARISIAGIASNDLSQVVELKAVASSISLAPDFAKRTSGHGFVTGGSSLVLHQKMFFGGYKEKVLYKGMDFDGIITNVSWEGSYIAFTNDTGTRIYERNLERLIALIQPIHSASAHDVVKCEPSHCWIDSETFAVGWYNTIIICVVVDITGETSDSKGVASSKKVEVHYSWSIDLYVADISFSMSDDVNKSWKEIVVFSMKKNSEEENVDDDKASKEMILALLEPNDLSSYTLTNEDRIEMSSCSPQNLSSFHMSALPNESLYFLLGSRELIQAQPCSADDRVRWFLENDLLREAMEYSAENKSQLQDLDPVDIGKRYLDSLFAEKRFSEAAANLKIVCGRQKDLWEYYVNEFEKNNVVLQLAKYLPVKDPQLEPECYQYVLSAALFNHPLLFHNLIKVWNPDLYRVGAIINLAQNRVLAESTNVLSEQNAVAIYRSLARLYLYERKYDKALALYITLNDKSIFQVIEKYQLFDLVKSDLAKLLSIDTDLTIRLLIENASSLPSKTVITQISKYPKLQLAYLNKLFERNEGDEFINLAIRLYAELEPKQLLTLLRKTDVYDIAKALEICERKQYINEMVYLLGKSGNRLKALDLLVNKLNRMDMAIEFCRENDDRDLWSALIDASMLDSNRITQLLNTAGTSVNPLHIIEKIPPKMEVPELRNSLTKILHDYEIQVEMQNGCLEVTLADSNLLFRTHLNACKSPNLIDFSSSCFICKSSLISCGKPIGKHFHGVDIVIFGCGHATHAACLSETSELRSFEAGVCPVCSDMIVIDDR